MNLSCKHAQLDVLALHGSGLCHSKTRGMKAYYIKYSLRSTATVVDGASLVYPIVHVSRANLIIVYTASPYCFMRQALLSRLNERCTK